MFLFFDFADKILFVRDDAESATWSVDQMSLQATFPYKSEKEITRGMRVGFQDVDGWQVFEIRKVRNYEPDHYQEITAESIAISELTDEVYAGEDVTDQTIAQTLGPMLTDTGWQIGTNTTSNTSSMSISTGDVWNNVREIEQNWNAIITPRLTVGNSGITGRYLDVAPNEGTWRGVRLSLEKNASDLGVTWDDSEVKTALYGYGKEENDEKLTFADEVWTATSDHPAKPSGQTYIEDPTAKSLYGRNGRNRFGYYQNADIGDAETLLQKTWEMLQTVNAPTVTVNALVRDLYRLGYADQPIRLHDKVVVEIRPEGKLLTLDVTKLDIDLLDPTQTRPTIGKYIPNIIYIDRETDATARGGYGRGLGDTQTDNTLKLMNTTIIANGEAISLEAYQRAYEDGQLSSSLLDAWASIDLKSNQITSLVTGTGTMLNSDGTLVVDAHGNPVFTGTGGGLYSKITQQADRIDLVVTGTGSGATVNTASIVLAINGGTGHSSAKIEADQILLTGSTTLDGSVNVLGRLSIDSDDELFSSGPIATTNYIKASLLTISDTNGTASLTSTNIKNSFVSAKVTNSDTLTVKKQDSTTAFTIEKSGSSLVISDGTGTITFSGAAAGWASAAAAVVWPSAGTSTSFGVTVPASTENTTTSKTFTLSSSGNYCICSDGTNTVARWNRTGQITAASPTTTQPSSGNNLRTVSVSAGSLPTYVKLSASGYRAASNNDYITIKVV